MAAYDDEPDPFDDDEEELPVIPAPGTAAPPAQSKARHKVRTTPDAKRGNTKAGDARLTRDQIVREAQGKERTEPEPWREEISAGDRSKAVATLSSRRHTHNSGSGFGLA